MKDYHRNLFSYHIVMDKRLKDYYDGLFSPEEESEVQRWLALHGKDESVSDSLRELFDGEEKRSGEQTLMYKRIVPNPNGNKNGNNGKNIRETLSELCARKRKDCAEIKAKCTEYELDSNNITKIKTFNGVPHEAVVL